MNRLRELFVFFILLGYCGITSATTFPEFLKNDGMKVMAQLAHPLQNYVKENSRCIIQHDTIIFDINYREGRTIVRVSLKQGIINNTKVLADTSPFPFAAVSLFDAWAGRSTENVLEPTQKRVRKFYEKLYGKKTSQFSGHELASAILAYTWAVVAQSQDPISNSLSEVKVPANFIVKIIDGIAVVGTNIFVERVSSGLDVIKLYNPESYKILFSSGLVKGIISSPEGSRISNANTVRDGWFIDLSTIHYFSGSQEDARLNKYSLAGTLIHEAIHLYQFYEYAQLFDCNLENSYLLGYTYDPITIAEKEQEACSYQIAFLNKISKKINASSSISTLINRAKFHAQTYNDKYNVFLKAGSHLFYGLHPNSENSKQHVNTACDIFESEVRNRNGLQVAAKYLKNMYCSH